MAQSYQSWPFALAASLGNETQKLHFGSPTNVLLVLVIALFRGHAFMHVFAFVALLSLALLTSLVLTNILDATPWWGRGGIGFY